MQDVQNVIKELFTEHPKQQELSNQQSCAVPYILALFFGFFACIGSLVGFFYFAFNNFPDKYLYMFGLSVYIALYISFVICFRAKSKKYDQIFQEICSENRKTLERINQEYEGKNVRFLQNDYPAYLSLELDFLTEALAAQAINGVNPLGGVAMYQSPLPGMFGTLPPKPQENNVQGAQNGDGYMNADYAKDHMQHP